MSWGEYTTKDNNLKPNKKKQLTAECTFTYWTNDSDVPRGAALTLARCADIEETEESMPLITP